MSSITEDAFWSLVDVTLDDGCWLWTGSVSRDGYGVCSSRATGSSRAHRVAYELCRGEIPEGLDLDHLCRVRSCVRPSHLEPVTRSENVKRGWAVNGRRRPWLQPGEKTVARSWKPPPALYDRVKGKLEARGRTMTSLLVEAIEKYDKENP